LDCRKLSGSAFTTNTIVKAEDFSFTGTPKEFQKKSDNGNRISLYFCGECGCSLWGEGGFGDAKVVRVGILDDDGLENAKPMLECFSERRVTWLKEVEGATSVIGMGNSKDVVQDRR
jgi:hypothetical protein